MESENLIPIARQKSIIVSQCSDYETIEPDKLELYSESKIRKKSKPPSPWNMSESLFTRDSIKSNCNIQNHSIKKYPLNAERIFVPPKVFLFLHFPTGIQYVYHFILICIIITDCVMLNLLKKPLDRQHFVYQGNYVQAYFAMNILDFILSIWLIIEVCLRLWCVDFQSRYNGLFGKAVYFYDYLAKRFLDIFGILTFVAFLILNMHNEASKSDRRMVSSKMITVDLLFRFAHLIQLLQIYRVVYELVRPLKITLNAQMSQILLAILGMLIVVIITSFLVYLIERGFTQTKIKFISESFWLSFETFSILGYGDLIPFSGESKFVLSIMALIGVTAFVLPSHIIGNGLSLTIQDQRRLTFKYLSAATLIRTAIVHQQNLLKSTNRDKKSDLRAYLLADHIAASQFPRPVQNDCVVKVNMDTFEHNDQSEKLWNKLLMIQHKNIDNNKKLKKKNNNESGRILNYFQNIDLTKYSNNNSILWYNVSLVEEDITDMSQLMCEKIVRKVNRIQELISNISSEQNVNYRK